MNTLAMENTSSRTLFHSNPVLSRLSRVTERADGDTATYAGIASKTAFFLLITLVGVVAQLVCGKDPLCIGARLADDHGLR